jgi:hypothetical protein
MKADMIATQCDGCGHLEVVPRATHDARDRVPDEQAHGHHVMPGDQDNDWICYGQPIEVDHPEAIAAHAERSIYGVAELQISDADRVAMRELSYDERKLALASGDFVREAAEIEAKIASASIAADINKVVTP